jgi:ATP-dependent RNA helicase HelY
LADRSATIVSDLRADIVGRYPFALDPFQLEAIEALDGGRHVVVAAPTSSGKTVVAEYGIETTLRSGKRSFYTAPLKALSNQKFRDLVARHGPGRVGLLTGDNAVDGDAPIVVMTTEVLRNMIYARSRALDNLGLVVLDEVHFLQDAYRGPVWEEVIIHLPQHIRLVCLSATVSNSAELAAWIETVRGPTASVVETKRPVRLDDHYLVGDRTNDRLHCLPTFVHGYPNPDASKIDAMAVRGRGSYSRRPLRGSGQRALYTPGRIETIDLLAERRLLPAIFFIFSRNQCEDAARSAVAAGVRLTSTSEREAIKRIVDQRLAGLDDVDLEVLGYGALLAQLDAGVAPHHAGMVPAFKEAVEQCFIAGLLKVVFATETLAVGVNMPARTVVIEKLTKFTGDHHELLTPGEYTQLTGRAGRRGIDEVGQAVVLWSPFVPFDRVAALAGSRSFHLRSAFRPTYNMAANLVRAYSPAEAHHLLNLSFAQYQADRDVVRLEARRERLQASAAEARRAADSPFGDIWEYRAQRAAEKGRSGVTAEREAALARLRPGDVLSVKRGRYSGPAVMVASASRKTGMRLTVISEDADAILVTGDDIPGPIAPIGRVKLPNGFLPKSREYRRDVARRLSRASLQQSAGAKRRARRGDGDGHRGVHPVELDPDLRERMRAAAQVERFERELADITSRVEGHHRSLGHEFDRVIDVLSRRGYVVGADRPDDGGGWSLTAKGRMLASVFHESDLLIAECMAHGILDSVDAPELAGLLSTFVYEHRSPEPPAPPWFPSDRARTRWRRIAAASEDLAADERSSELNVHRPPDPGFFAAAHAWTAGHALDTVVGDDELTGGDFVRTMKQLIDLARQVGDVAPSAATRAVARELTSLAFRGIVADGSLSGVDAVDDDIEIAET